MTDVVVIALLLVIIGGAARYIYKAKKRGVKCIGCPAAGTCGSCGGQRSCQGCPAGGCRDTDAE